MRTVAIAAAAGLGLLCAGAFVGGASAMVGTGSTTIQSAAQEIGGTVTVAAKKKMKKMKHAMRRRMRAPAQMGMMSEPHFGGAMTMGNNCWVDPDGRGVAGYWKACK